MPRPGQWGVPGYTPRVAQQFVEIKWDLTVQLYRIRCPYDKSFVDELKVTIDYKDRGWDAASKTWAFSEPYLQKIEELVERHYPAATVTLFSRVEVETEAAKNATLPSEEFSATHKAMIAFCQNLDVESLGAAFKNRAKRLHPDTGGSSAQFAEFNSAYQELRKVLA